MLRQPRPLVPFVFNRAALNGNLLDSLIGYWKMDSASWSGVANVVIDASGNGNHGQAANGANTAVGLFGRAGSFDGTDDYVSVPVTTLGDAGSFAFWMKPASLTPGLSVVFGASQGVNSLFCAATNTGEIQFRTSSASTFSNTTTTGAGITVGAWAHVVCVYANPGRYVYVNGVLAGSSPTNTDWRTSIASASLGARARSSLYYSGLIDEARVYSRALSSDEALQLYQLAL